MSTTGYGAIANRVMLSAETLTDAQRDEQFRTSWLHNAVTPAEYERVHTLPMTILRDMYAPVYENGPNALRWLADMHIIQRALRDFEGQDRDAGEWVQDRFGLYASMPSLTANERHRANASLRKIAGESWVRLITVPAGIRELNDPGILTNKYGVTIFSADFSAKLEWFSYVSLMYDVMSSWGQDGAYPDRYRNLLQRHVRLVDDLRVRAAPFEL